VYPVSLVAFVAGENGSIRDICLTKMAGFDLDVDAVANVAQYKFDRQRRTVNRLQLGVRLGSFWIDGAVENSCIGTKTPIVPELNLV
jgi:hypothetical protein